MKARLWDTKYISFINLGDTEIGAWKKAFPGIDISQGVWREIHKLRDDGWAFSTKEDHAYIHEEKLYYRLTSSQYLILQVKTL